MFLTDQQLHSWALWMKGALQFFRRAWKVDSLEDLHKEVARRDLALKHCDFMPGGSLRVLGLPSESIPPPCAPGVTAEQCLILHWRTFANMLATVSPMAQEWFHQPSFMGTYSLIISVIPPLPWPSHPAACNSHFHLETVLRNLNLPGFVALWQSISSDRELSGAVTNFVFQAAW